MDWRYTPYIWPVIIAGVISGSIAIVAWKRRPAPGATAFALLMLSVTEWSLLYAFEIVSRTLTTKIFWADLEWIAIAIIPTLWLVFALQYTGRGQWLSPRTAVLLAIEPVLTLLFVWASEFTGLMRAAVSLDTSGPFATVLAARGPWFWLNVVYSYSLLGAGTFMLIQVNARYPRLYRGQAAALVLGALAPWLGNAITVFGLSPVPGLDLTPFAFSLAGIALAWSLFHYRLLDLIPAARDTVFESMGDGVMVLDAQNRIVDLNPAAQAVVQRQAPQAIGAVASRVLPALNASLEDPPAAEKTREITIGDGQTQRSVELHLSTLHDRDGRLTGRVVVLHDVTTRNQAEQLIHEREKRFRALSQRFSEVQETERKLIAADLHDSVVQWLSGTLFRVEAVRRLLDNGDHASVKAELTEIESAIQYGIRELRTTIVRLYPADVKMFGLVTALSQYTEQWSARSTVEATFEVTGRETRLPLAVETGLYRICQEALNNVAKHAQATAVRVTLDFDSGHVTLIVQDNGIGIPTKNIARSGNVFWYTGGGNIKESHIGLLDMSERAQLLNGYLELKSTPGAGTIVSARLPVDEGIEENDYD